MNLEKWKSARVYVMGMSINTSMSWGETRAKYLLLLLMELLCNFKALYRKSISLEDTLLPLMVWTLGCFLRVTPEQAAGECEMDKHMENSSPLDSWYIHGAPSDFRSWLSSEEQREKIHPWKKMQPTLGHAWLSVPSSSQSVLLACRFSVPWSTPSTTLLLHDLQSVVVFKTAMPHVQWSGASQGTTLSGYVLVSEMTRLLGNRLLSSGADVWVSTSRFQWLEIMSEKQRPSSPEGTASAALACSPYTSTPLTCPIKY